MRKDSLFSILSRAPWWMSLVIAAVVFAAIRLVLPDIAAFFAALPFLVIACYAGWRQTRTPNADRVARAVATLRAMSSDNFSKVIGEAFRYDGYAVTKLADGAADFELRKNGRVTIVGCRRWKVAQTGIGPLRELLDAKRRLEANDCIYVGGGEINDNARKFATENSIQLMNDAALGELVARFERSQRSWFFK
jgi:restriction system protein